MTSAGDIVKEHTLCVIPFAADSSVSASPSDIAVGDVVCVLGNTGATDGIFPAQSSDTGPFFVAIDSTESASSTEVRCVVDGFVYVRHNKASAIAPGAWVAAEDDGMVQQATAQTDIAKGLIVGWAPYGVEADESEFVLIKLGV